MDYHRETVRKIISKIGFLLENMGKVSKEVERKTAKSSTPKSEEVLQMEVKKRDYAPKIDPMKRQTEGYMLLRRKSRQITEERYFILSEPSDGSVLLSCYKGQVGCRSAGKPLGSFRHGGQDTWWEGLSLEKQSEFEASSHGDLGGLCVWPSFFTKIWPDLAGCYCRSTATVQHFLYILQLKFEGKNTLHLNIHRNLFHCISNKFRHSLYFSS